MSSLPPALSSRHESSKLRSQPVGSPPPVSRHRTSHQQVRLEESRSRSPLPETRYHRPTRHHHSPSYSTHHRSTRDSRSRSPVRHDYAYTSRRRHSPTRRVTVAPPDSSYYPATRKRSVTPDRRRSLTPVRRRPLSPDSSLSPPVRKQRSETPARIGVFELPPVGTRYAPKKFTGKSDEVTDFINHYERLLRQYKISNNKERCQSILQYCSLQVKLYIKGLREYADWDWTALKKNLLFFYDAEKGEHAYRACDVVEFAQKACERVIQNMGMWKKYYRRFVRRSGTL
ncbi:hypothetical protein BD626DRAFT_405305, partial [Schizophyllum amplum]